MRTLEQLRALPPEALDVSAAREVLALECESHAERWDRLRVLRNACAGGPEVQRFLLLDQRPFFSEVMKALLAESQTNPQDDNLTLTLSLQLLHNAYTGQHELVAKDYDHLTSVAKACLSPHAGRKVRTLAAAVFRLTAKLQTDVDASVLTALLVQAKESDFAVLALKDISTIEPCARAMREAFERLEPEEKATILEVISCDVKSPEATNWAVFAAGRFKRLATAIMVTLKDAPEQADPQELMAALEAVGHFSAQHDGPGDELRKDKSLLIDAVYLLKMVHQAGKEDSNGLFAPVGRAADVAAVGGHIDDHPAYGLKSNLARLVGNLCWRSKVNQNQVRELEGIQLLLDCSSIDAKNPLMIQWAVFALRNLCEDNEENRRLLAGVDGAGVAVHTLEQEFNIRAVNQPK